MFTRICNCTLWKKTVLLFFAKQKYKNIFFPLSVVTNYQLLLKKDQEEFKKAHMALTYAFKIKDLYNQLLLKKDQEDFKKAHR